RETGAAMNDILTIDGHTRIMKPGDVLQVSPGQRHTFAAHGGHCLVLEVSLPSIPGDNIFVDTRIGNNGVL
ncbi:MAG: D-lyxose/D-mannose family sugar isomerase, partial [Armatimonadaceae bacterium]